MSDSQDSSRAPDEAPLVRHRPALNAAVAAAILGVSLIFCGHYIAGNLPISGDITLFNAPIYSLHWDGGLPLWNRFVACGMPMDANLQFMAFYPLRWPFYFLDDWRTWFGAYLWLHGVIALAGMYGCLRSMRLSPPSALAGAVIFAFGGHMMARLVNITIYLGSCWLPWLIWGATARKTSSGPMASIGIVMIMLTGSPHVIVYGPIGFALAWFVWAAADRRSIGKSDSRADGKSPFLRPWIYFGVGVLIGLVNVAPGLLSVRETVRTETNIENNLENSLRPAEITPSLLGGAWGDIIPEKNDKCFYIGGAAIFLILLGAMRRRSWSDRRWLLGVILTLSGLAIAFGKYVGWQVLLPYIWGLNLLEGPARALVLTALGLAILTAVGCESLPDAPLRSRLGAAALAMLMVLYLVMRLHGYWPSNRALIDLLLGWLLVPGSLVGPAFPLINTPLTLLPALAVALAWRWRRPPGPMLLKVVFALMIIGQLHHFVSRVEPITVSRGEFDPPPPVRHLMDLDATEPFRVAAFDPLRFHHTEMNNVNKVRFLMPNLATIYGLEDISAYDPLINRHYQNLFKRTAGVAPYVDPLRNLEPAYLDPELLHELNVRYVIGNPRDRLLTMFPLFASWRNPSIEVEAWTRRGENRPVEAWHFVSLIDRPGLLKPGAILARLVIEADEGTFMYPIRRGIETDHVRDHPIGRAQLPVRINMTWRWFSGDRGEGFRQSQANYRATVAFEKPLHVRRVKWEIMRNDFNLVVSAQGYRLAGPDPDPDWRLEFADPIAPIYEFLDAAPRASLLGDYAIDGPNAVTGDTPDLPGRIDRVQCSANGLQYDIDSPEPALFVLRESWAPGWKASVDGREAEVLRVDDLFRGVEVPAGRHRLRMRYAPKIFYASAWASLISLMALIVFHRKIRRGRRERRKGCQATDSREAMAPRDRV